MKTIKLIITGFFCLILSMNLFAQGPPDPPGGHGSDEDEQPGGNAHLSGGITILLTLTALYCSKKVYILTSENKEEA